MYIHVARRQDVLATEFLKKKKVRKATRLGVEYAKVGEEVCPPGAGPGDGEAGLGNPQPQAVINHLDNEERRGGKESVCIIICLPFRLDVRVLWSNYVSGDCVCVLKL